MILSGCNRPRKLKIIYDKTGRTRLKPLKTVDQQTDETYMVLVECVIGAFSGVWVCFKVVESLDRSTFSFPLTQCFYVTAESGAD